MMKIVSKITQPRSVGLALVFGIMGMVTLVHAIPPNQVMHTASQPSFTGKCCFSWGDSVTVTEPTQITPVVVVWSSDYATTVPFNVGIAVNNHPCQVTDFLNMDPKSPIGRSRAFQWVILPSDGLIKGNNTITLCGGGIHDTDTITLGFRSLGVTFSK